MALFGNRQMMQEQRENQAFVRIGRNVGVITEVFEDYFQVAFHNGMKIIYINVSKNKKVTFLEKEEFENYCRSKGHTSMLDLIK